MAEQLENVTNIGFDIIKNDLLFEVEIIKIKRTWKERLFKKPLLKIYGYENKIKPYAMFIDNKFYCHGIIYEQIKNGIIGGISINVKGEYPWTK